MQEPVRQAMVLLVGLCVGWVLAACGDSRAPSPFTAVKEDAGVDGAGADAQSDGSGPTYGGPCQSHEQCDDTVECTTDSCDPKVSRCLFQPNHGACQDQSFCNGVEICEPLVGCRPGAPRGCSDNNTCTIDRCDESAKGCRHEPRDADGDGDPDWLCGGGDCHDGDPLVSSLVAEVCDNNKDDNCDQQVDEKSCQSPKHDVCSDALAINSSTTHELSLVATAPHLSASCSPSGMRDVVAAVVVPTGPAQDLDVIALADSGSIAIAAFGQCGDASSELACHAGVPRVAGGKIARIKLRNLGAGAYPIALWSSADKVTLKVQRLSAEPKPKNETCGSAEILLENQHRSVDLVDATVNVKSECPWKTGDLVYEIQLSQPRDLHAHASSLDGYGRPSLAFFTSPQCLQERTCSSGNPAHAFLRAKAAGSVYLAVGASAPSLVDLVVKGAPATQPSADESCTGAPKLALPPSGSNSVQLDLSSHENTSTLGCLAGGVDAAYSLDVIQTSDLMLLASGSAHDTIAVALAKTPCASPGDALACRSGSSRAVRATRLGVPPGNYRAVVESQNAVPVKLTVISRPSQTPVWVPFADSCSDAFDIPPQGGRFFGNTANANPHFVAGCDFGGNKNAADQLLRLKLSKSRRVILDTQGSGYSTLINLRQGAGCPGKEIPGGCVASTSTSSVFVDQVLAPGDYFVQVDGYAGEAGPWTLDVFLVDP